MKPRMLLLILILLAITIMTVSSEDADAEGVARIGDVVYPTLNGALENALPGDIVIVYDGCHLSEDASVPAGVILLIPYTDGHGDVDTDGFEYGPVPGEGGYRKKAGDSYCRTHLYIDNSARLTVYGDVIIGGIIGEKFTFDYQGHTYGEHGRIVLNGSMVMENGSSLKCYGYITGPGDINARNGSEVSEPFIITDFVGGDRMLKLYQAKQSPFDRYSFSNIESEMTVDYGARLIGFLNLYADGEMNSSKINIIGIQGSQSPSLIELVNGSSATLTYDRTRYVKSEWSSNIWNDIGRTTVSINGGADLDVLVMTYHGQTADMSDIPFSIPYNFGYILKDGVYNVYADMRILPGADIIVDGDASLIVNGNVTVFNGLEDPGYRDKYYPGADLLSNYGFSTHGSLYVNGSLQISSGGSVLGVVESTSGNPIITVDPSVTAYRDWYVNFGTGSSNTFRSLSLWVCHDGAFFVLQPGSQYALSPGTTTVDGFTYTYNGSTVKKEIEQTYEGRYIPTSSTPVLSMTVSLDNVNVTDASVTLTKGDVVIPLTYESGLYVTYSAYDGGYSVRIELSGNNIDAGTVSIKDGKGAASIQLFSVSFISEGTKIGEGIGAYGKTVSLLKPEKTGYTFNGWYDGSILFNSKSAVTHRTSLNALWGVDTEEHRNVTGEMFPIVVTDSNEDITALFDDYSVRVFLQTKAQNIRGPLSVSYSVSDKEYRITVTVDGSAMDAVKTVTLSYDIIRPGAVVVCNDGFEISDLTFDRSSQAVTFTSMGSSFSVNYDPDPEPIDLNPRFDIGLIIVIAAIAVTALVIVVMIILIKRR